MLKLISIYLGTKHGLRERMMLGILFIIWFYLMLFVKHKNSKIVEKAIPLILLVNTTSS